MHFDLKLFFALIFSIGLLVYLLSCSRQSRDPEDNDIRAQREKGFHFMG